MNKKIVINHSQYESRVALLEDDNLKEIFIERANEKSSIGSIVVGKVTRVLPGMNSAFVDIGQERAAFLFGGDVVPEELKGAILTKSTFSSTKIDIKKSLCEGQNIVVQINKEALGHKGPRASMLISLPGRFLVLIPHFSHIAISRRIDDEDQRKKLQEKIEKITTENVGLIARTAAIKADIETLKAEFDFLYSRWLDIEKKIPTASHGTVLFQDLDFICKMTRDFYCDAVSQILIDDTKVFTDLEKFLDKNISGAASKLQLHSEKTPIFDRYNIEFDIGHALKKRVDLPCGGYLLIEQTEALCSFDVNTGKYIGRESAQATILKTNLEAIPYIVDQLRIRNVGGMIIVDFIDLENTEDQKRIYDSLLIELKKDRTRTNVLPLSELGLVQMTRKRIFNSLERKLLSPCPYCDNLGLVRSTETEVYDLLREITRHVLQTNKKKIQVKLRNDVMAFVCQKKNQMLLDLQNKLNIEIELILNGFDPNHLREAAYEVLP